MKILVTDDSKMARRMLIKTLNEYTSDDCIILEATNGKECIEIFKEEQPNLVFLDLTMPVMDGFEALKYLKLHNKDVIVIIVSADIQKGSLDKVMADGANDFVKKPIDAAKMKAIFEKFKE